MKFRLIIAISLFAVSLTGEAGALSLESCAAIEHPDERLACYDRLAGRLSAGTKESNTKIPATVTPVAPRADSILPAVSGPAATPAAREIPAVPAAAAIPAAPAPPETPAVPAIVATPAVPTAATTPAVPTAAPTPAVPTAVTPPAVPAPAVTSNAPAVEPTTHAETVFGLEHKEKRPEELQFKWAGKKKDAYGKWIITLENGQIWRQTDSTRFTFRNPEKQVVISRGFMDSFFLGEPGRNTKIRVKRVK